MTRKFFSIVIFALAGLLFANFAKAQSFSRDFSIGVGTLVHVKNPYGRVEVKTDEEKENQATLDISSNRQISEDDLRIDGSGKRLRIEVLPQPKGTRVDIKLTLLPRSKVRLETDEGEIHVIGDFVEATAKSQTGTIYADVSLQNLKYKFQWVASKPRVIADVDLADVKEKAAGRFQIKGQLNEKPIADPVDTELDAEPPEDSKESDKKKKKKIKKNFGRISLDFTTARGIILLNVSPNEVPSNLLERPLTEAARAIIRSGDSMLVNAIRRASPKYFGEYAATLPPRKTMPLITNSSRSNKTVSASIKKVTVQVTDINNRAILGLEKSDFTLSERGDEREILAVEKSTAPFNLVLLLDVSGSIEHYVDFIRKAARNFINTTSKQDKIALVVFNEDVKTLSSLTTDRNFLSESLDTFDAGGGTAYYDSLAYSLTETLRSLKGDRTAIVVLSDGDDNRSFLPFNSLLGSIQESGALIYPLYVPSGLIAASATNDPSKSIDPLRNRYMSLTSKAQKEGEILAKVSGGVYYPISRVTELQEAYNDIVLQLRTAYTITYRSNSTTVRQDRASPRLKVKVKRDTAFVKLGPVVAADSKEVSKLEKKSLPKTEAYPQKLDKGSVFKASKLRADVLPEITGEIDSIKYQQFLGDKLRTFQSQDLDINKAPGAFLVSGEKEKLAVSRWISPKRTRSYPYERVYDTLAHKGKRVAVIPVVKDEGLGGDRDFIQWDTISLLSLLDVHVVLAYYDDAIKNSRKADKITKQQFDREFIRKRLKMVEGFTPQELRASGTNSNRET